MNTIYPIFRRLTIIFSLALLIATGTVMVARHQKPQFLWVILFSRHNPTYDVEFYRVATNGLAFKRLTYIPGYEHIQGSTPDHQWMIIQSGANKLLYHVNPSTGQIENRIAMPARFEAWSPDNEWIIIRSDGRESNDLFRVRPDGSDLQQITVSAGTDQFVAWTPDGEWMIAISDGVLWRVRPDGSQHEIISLPLIHDRVKPFYSWEVVNFAEWTPDGEWLIFDLCCERVNSNVNNVDSYASWRSEIFRMRADDNRIEQLSRSFSLNWISSLSPDGEWIIFRSDRASSGLDLYRMRIDGSGFQRLTSGDNITTDVQWSEDGLWMKYMSRLTPYSRTKMRLDGSERQGYSASGCNYYGIEVQEGWLYYRQDYSRQAQLYIPRPDCSEPRVIFTDDYRDQAFMTLAPVFDVSAWHPARLILISLLAIIFPPLTRRMRSLR